MKSIKIAGVPEHFNLPWHLCIENGEFEEKNIDLQWIDVPEGTGKLCKMLREDEVDLAVILTEGIIKDIIEGNPSKIIQTYVESPLIWGIHVSAKSPYQTIEDIKDTKAAISRFGSGSHLMAYVNAHKYNWDTNKLTFEIVNTIDGAVEALSNGTADYFMWERFMTKPLVDKGIFRRIGDCPTPWPSFVIVATNKAIEENLPAIKSILEVINTTTQEFKIIPSIDKTLSTRYNQKIEDIQQWLSLTRWSQKQLNEKTFNMVQDQLSELNLIDNKTDYTKVIKT